MRAMMAIVVARPMPAAAARHGQAALLAELRVLSFHARGDFGHIGNDVRTQPHGIGCAGLLNIDGGRGGSGALSNRPADAAKQQCADRQCQLANKKNAPHLFLPGLE